MLQLLYSFWIFRNQRAENSISIPRERSWFNFFAADSWTVTRNLKFKVRIANFWTANFWTFELFIPFWTKLGPMKRPELLNLLLKLHKTAWNIRLIQLWISRFFWWHKKDWCVAIIQVDFQPFGRVSRYCQFHLQNRQYQEIIDCNWKNHYAGHFSLNLNPYWQILENSSWNFSGAWDRVITGKLIPFFWNSNFRGMSSSRGWVFQKSVLLMPRKVANKG